MGQQEIQKILMNLHEDTWMSTKQLTILTGVGNNSTTSYAIKKMKKFGEVESRQIKEGKNNHLEHRLTKKGREW